MLVTVNEPAIYPVIIPTTSHLRSYNFYLIAYNESLFLVDAGVDTEKCWQAFLNVLEKYHFSIDQMEAIILTHNHADHIGLVNRILSKTSIPVYAHEKAIIRLKRDESFLEKRVRFYKKLYREMGCGVDAKNEVKRLEQSITKNKSLIIEEDINILQEGDQIFGFTVIEVPGHSPDHIALFHETSGIMLAGDHVIKHMSSNALIELGENDERTPSLRLYEKSLKKLLKLPITTLYAGHGDQVNLPKPLIRNKLKRIEEKGENILHHLQMSRTAAELAKILYQDKYDTLLPLVMSDIIGHLDRLENEKKVKKRMHANVFYYVAVS